MTQDHDSTARSPSRLAFLSPGRLFLLCALGVGALLVFLTPPFQVPDEPAHFLRAYAVSEGRFLPQARTEGLGHELPVSLERLINLTLDGIPFHPEERFESHLFASAAALRLESDVRRFQVLTTAAVFPPVAYVPQAAGIALARAVGGGPLILLYGGRLANLIVATFLIAAAIRWLPAGRWFGCLLALLPMVLFLRSSLSPDALTFALAMVLAAQIAALSFAGPDTLGPQNVRRAQSWLVVAAALLCLTKLPYVPLVAGVLAVPARRGALRRKTLVATTLVVATAASAVSWFYAARVKVPLRPEAGVDPGARFLEVAAAPWNLLGRIVTDYVARGPGYAAEAIGRLGWLDAPLPFALLGFLAATLFYLALCDAEPGAIATASQRAVLAICVVASAFAVSAALYVSWTSAGAPGIEGIQGRYLLPLVPILFWVLVSPVLSRRFGHHRSAVTAVAVAAALAGTILVVARRYYLG